MVRLVHGIGTNTIKGDGKTPTYKTWQAMLVRASGPFQATHPTYKGVEVCEAWRDYATFKQWMLLQNYEGRDLDKDLILDGNKVYCPEYCRFILRATNVVLTTGRKKKAGDNLPVGVHKTKYGYRATVGNVGNLGYARKKFKDLPDAVAFRNQKKAQQIQLHQKQESDPLIRLGLQREMDKLIS